MSILSGIKVNVTIINIEEAIKQGGNSNDRKK
jgi:hypothetical protein